MKELDTWTKRFKEVVQAEIDKAGGRRSVAYRAVADKTGLGYDYIYQIFMDKPTHKPARPGPDAMDAIWDAYGSGEVVATAASPGDEHHTAESVVRDLVLQLADHLIALSPTRRKQAAVLLEAIALTPEDAKEPAEDLSTLVSRPRAQETAVWHSQLRRR